MENQEQFISRAHREKITLLRQLQQVLESPHHANGYLWEHRREKEEFLSQLRWNYRNPTEVQLTMDNLTVVHKVAELGPGEKLLWGFLEKPQPTIVMVPKESYAGKIEIATAAEMEEKVMEQKVVFQTFNSFVAYFLIRRQTLRADERGPERAPPPPAVRIQLKRRNRVKPEFYLQDFRAACTYLSKRKSDLELLVAEIGQKKVWTGCSWPAHTDNAAVCMDFQTLTVVRELVPSDPHETSRWAVLYFTDNVAKPMYVATFEQFAAYVLARFW